MRAVVGWPTILMLLTCATLFGVVSGAVAAWYVVMSTPIPPSIAIVDSDAMLRQAIVLDPNNPKAAADRVIAQTKLRVASLVAQGIIVLDRNSVIDAPAALVVRTEPAMLSIPPEAEEIKRKSPVELLLDKAAK
ncbi:MAG: hypothetical protein EAZ30_02870 [Betaproteobacteria bacterium]|nr:MAG: hypothetical protein EAZ30_02870 [Betaproteobacteria bacterium]